MILNKRNCEERLLAVLKYYLANSENRDSKVKALLLEAAWLLERDHTES